MDEKYFVAKIQYDFPDENTGKIKKVREEKLVKGFSVTDVEASIPFAFSVTTCSKFFICNNASSTNDFFSLIFCIIK